MSSEMQLRILTTGGTACETVVVKVTVLTASGWWTYLPNHRDMVATVLPCVVRCETSSGQLLAAVDEGILHKDGDHLDIAVRQAQTGATIESLEEHISEVFEKVDEQESRVRRIVAQLEKDFATAFAMRRPV